MPGKMRARRNLKVVYESKMYSLYKRKIRPTWILEPNILYISSDIFVGHGSERTA